MAAGPNGGGRELIAHRGAVRHGPLAVATSHRTRNAVLFSAESGFLTALRRSILASRVEYIPSESTGKIAPNQLQV